VATFAEDGRRGPSFRRLRSQCSRDGARGGKDLEVLSRFAGYGTPGTGPRRYRFPHRGKHMCTGHRNLGVTALSARDPGESTGARAARTQSARRLDPGSKLRTPPNSEGYPARSLSPAVRPREVYGPDFEGKARGVYLPSHPIGNGDDTTGVSLTARERHSQRMPDPMCFLAP